MMLGLRDRFEYLECGGCRALQIRHIPADLSPYYAPPYYSFQRPSPSTPLRRRLSRRLAHHALHGFDPIGALMALRSGDTSILRGIRDAGLDRGARILDVGAGSGQTLFTFHDYGFRHLMGVDPFLDADLRYENGVVVLKAGLNDVDGAFDLMMFHHSFEHVPDPAATLAAARDRLRPGGHVLVRTPVAAESWRRYGPDWVELDAPRHLHVHTEASMRVLAHQSGFDLTAVRYEAWPAELWASEQYRQGIPLTDPRSHAPGGKGQVFGRREMRRFAARARALRRAGASGRAAFWLAARA
jgi:2-polyprenyl-3-methyl-5-hydroxy-6-metoxy-1,4-benzoquinol methylase